jgi:hypothetical protein
VLGATKQPEYKVNLQAVFRRRQLSTLSEVSEWWMKGLKLLNIFFILYSIFHLCIVLFVFNNGYGALLVVPIFFLGVLLNLIILSGLLIEVICSKVLRLSIDFNKHAPVIKQVLTAMAVLIVLALSIADLSYYTK